MATFGNGLDDKVSTPPCKRIQLTNTEDDSPFVPECEILYENGPNSKDLYDRCTKNPGHPSFIPVKDFTMDHLPPEHRTETMMRYVKHRFDRTVKITVRSTSLNRPETYPNTNAPYPYRQYKGSKRTVRVGTGELLPIEYPRNATQGHCPCPQCKTSGKPEKQYYILQLRTALHVVYDNEEAMSAVCELFYDSEDRKGIKYLYGTKTYHDHSYKTEEKCNEDYFFLACVTHDDSLFRFVCDLARPGQFDLSEIRSLPIMISHPHGLSKHFTMGSVLHCVISKPLKATRQITYTIASGSKFRLIKNSKVSTSQDTFQNIVTSEKFFDGDNNDDDVATSSGIEKLYMLTKPVLLFLPDDAPYFFKKVAVKNDNSWGPWIQFSPESKFKIRDDDDDDESGRGENASFLLDAEFDDNHLNFVYNYDHGILDCFHTYDIDSCPGSSGAPVIFTSTDMSCDYWIGHSGAISSGFNRSGGFSTIY